MDDDEGKEDVLPLGLPRGLRRIPPLEMDDDVGSAIAGLGGMRRDCLRCTGLPPSPLLLLLLVLPLRAFARKVAIPCGLQYVYRLVLRATEMTDVVVVTLSPGEEAGGLRRKWARAPGKRGGVCRGPRMW